MNFLLLARQDRLDRTELASRLAALELRLPPPPIRALSISFPTSSQQILYMVSPPTILTPLR